MHYTITRGDFYTTTLPILIIYYLVVQLKYYRHELIAFFRAAGTAEGEGRAR